MKVVQTYHPPLVFGRIYLCTSGIFKISRTSRISISSIKQFSRIFKRRTVSSIAIEQSKKSFAKKIACPSKKYNYEKVAQDLALKREDFWSTLDQAYPNDEESSRIFAVLIKLCLNWKRFDNAITRNGLLFVD